MKLVESILTKNPCYTSGKKITVKGLMLHSVGCPQPKASVFINSWNSTSFGSACVHAFIDGNDGTVYQTLPWNHRGWHCASGKNGSGNNTHIGVEMCEPACIKYTGGSTFTCSDLTTAKAVAKRTYEAAVELFAMLCEKYKLDPLADGVIISHKEGCARGIASNHGDPEHFWKGLNMGYTMDTFRKDVKAAMGSNKTSTNNTTSTTNTNTQTKEMYRVGTKWENGKCVNQVGAYTILDNAKKTADGIAETKKMTYKVFNSKGEVVYAKEYKEPFKSYMVRVVIPNLRIRKSPNGEIIKVNGKEKYTGTGTFTIVDEQKAGDYTWGLLKSYEDDRDGWIAISDDFLKRV